MKVWIVENGYNEVLEVFHSHCDALEYAQNYLSEKAAAWHYATEELKEALAYLETLDFVGEVVYVNSYEVK